MMSARVIAVAFVFLFSVLFIFSSRRIAWSTQVRYGASPASMVTFQHTDHLDKPLGFKSENMTVSFEMMRRDALHDRKAVYLSKQETPPFDPAFKNPCWWLKKGKQNLACLPYFYLGGFPKSGTTDLFSRLVHHPYIIPASTKEPHYVTRGHFDFRGALCHRDEMGQIDYTSCDITGYAKQFFTKASNKIREIKSGERDLLASRGKETFQYPAITVDGSASTAWDNSNGHHIIRDIVLPQQVRQSNTTIIDWMLKVNPNVRIVMIMREPASRVYSDYNYFNNNVSPKSFDSHVDDFIRRFQKCTASGISDIACARSVHSNSSVVRMHIGLYSLYIKELLIRIPRERLLFIRTEDYHKDMVHELRNVFDFLQIPQLSASRMDNLLGSNEKNVNHKKVEDMLPATWNKLVKFYLPFNDQLAKLLQNDSYSWQDVYSKY